MSKKKFTRRSFLETVTGGTIGAVGASFMFSSESKASSIRNHKKLQQGATVLFQGDSITDAGRDKSNVEPNNSWALGQGYAFLAAASLRHSMASDNLQIHNRGISGNKVFQLAERWKEDCLQLKPDVLSILIGVNDFWHTLSGNYDGTVEVYEEDFRNLLQRTKEQLPSVQLIIGEPFVVEQGSSVNNQWFPDFLAYQEAAKRIAGEFDAAFIPYQSVFDKASQNVEPTYWTGDGVHPSMAGAQLMAQAWLETFHNL